MSPFFATQSKNCITPNGTRCPNMGRSLLLRCRVQHYQSLNGGSKCKPVPPCGCSSRCCERTEHEKYNRSAYWQSSWFHSFDPRLRHAGIDVRWGHRPREHYLEFLVATSQPDTHGTNPFTLCCGTSLCNHWPSHCSRARLH